MWAFRQFPDKIECKPYDKDQASHQVEVFGYLTLTGGVSLVCFRVCSFSAMAYYGEIEFLPWNEFESRFKEFRLSEKTAS